MKIANSSFIRPQSALALFLSVWCAIALGILVFGWDTVWTILGVPHISPPFADTRTVQASIQAVLAGLNPQIDNPAEPWQRPMNYPMVWYHLAKFLGLDNEARFVAFNLVMIAAFTAACARLLWQYPSLWMLALLFSSAVLNGVEQGNIDMVIFVLLFVSAGLPFFKSYMVVMLAALLKLFPVVALLILPRHRVHWLLILMTLVVFMFYMGPEIALIKQGTPISWGNSYGTVSIAKFIVDKLGVTVHHAWIGLFMLSAVFVLYKFAPHVRVTRPDAISTANKDLFHFGALVYLGSFLVGSNWDYRLMFLLFCVPCILSLDHRILRGAVLLLMLFAFNQYRLDMLGLYGFATAFLSKCALFVVLGWLVWRSAAPAFLNSIKSKFSSNETSA